MLQVFWSLEFGVGMEMDKQYIELEGVDGLCKYYFNRRVKVTSEVISDESQCNLYLYTVFLCMEFFESLFEDRFFFLLLFLSVYVQCIDVHYYFLYRE